LREYLHGDHLMCYAATDANARVHLLSIRHHRQLSLDFARLWPNITMPGQRRASMSYLYQVLTQRVDAWRVANDPCDAFPAIREILEFASADGGPASSATFGVPTCLVSRILPRLKSACPGEPGDSRWSAM